ncbi:hypothetical protein BGX38DRAFT_1264086 [Terfezia claveryi]|nr:hypothetical protein BGX38DRAFT_1264086 [Terfezia claveryi]
MRKSQGAALKFEISARTDRGARIGSSGITRIRMRRLHMYGEQIVKCADPGVAESAEAWLKFNEDVVIYNRNPSISIIHAGIPQSMQQPITEHQKILPVDEATTKVQKQLWDFFGLLGRFWLV